MLTQAAPMMGMTPDEARLVLDVMRPVHLLPDTLLFEEGDTEDNNYMVLVLDGQVRASSAGLPGEEVVISVIGPGSLIGEMGVHRWRSAFGHLHGAHRGQARRAIARGFHGAHQDATCGGFAARTGAVEGTRGSSA